MLRYAKGPVIPFDHFFTNLLRVSITNIDALRPSVPNALNKATVALTTFPHIKWLHTPSHPTSIIDPSQGQARRCSPAWLPTLSLSSLSWPVSLHTLCDTHCVIHSVCYTLHSYTHTMDNTSQGLEYDTGRPGPTPCFDLTHPTLHMACPAEWHISWQFLQQHSKYPTNQNGGWGSKYLHMTRTRDRPEICIS